MKPKPFPFQKQCVYATERFGGRALLALDCGLGKTMIALHYLRRNPDALPALVVCPASAKFVWEEEARKHVGWDASVLEGRRPSGNGNGKLTILNYDILEPRLASLKMKGFRTVVLDESHMVKSFRAKRTKAARALCRGVPYVLALSGTPLVNRPAELWQTLNILRPDIFPHFWKFGHRYCDPKRNPFSQGWDFKGATNVGELHEKLLKHLMIRRRKCEVLPELPNKMEQVVPCELSDPRQYKQAEDDFLAWLAEHHTGRLAGAIKAEAMIKVGYLLRLAAELKLAAVADWVNDFLEGADEKLVLFATHRKMIDGLREQCQTKSVVVHGGVTGISRKKAVHQFQHDPETRLFLGNTIAAGTAITLTAASTAAFAELVWVPGNLKQAADRIHRISQERTAWIYYLLARGTIENKLCRALRRKQKMIDAVLDGDGTDTGFDVFDELMKGGLR